MDVPVDPAVKDAFRRALEEVLQPRDELSGMQRDNTESLAHAFGPEVLRHPVSLIAPQLGAAEPIQNERATTARLTELINKNIALNKELQQLQQDANTPSSNANDTNAHEKKNRDVRDGEVLDLQLKVNSLEEKRARLDIFLKALDRLEKLPAAEPEYTNPTAMFEDCSPLPGMPKELMEGFTRDNSAPKQEIEVMMRGLHKAVLRNKLLAQREKRKVDAMRAEANAVDPSSLPAEVQLYALTAVKDHLIAWIESQLMQAGDEDDEEEDENGKPMKTGKEAGDQYASEDLDQKLADIQKEYSKHIQLRKEISALLAEASQVGQELETFRGMRIFHDGEESHYRQEDSSATTDSTPNKFDPPAVLMLAPFLEKLQIIAHEQKALVQEKSHINSTLNKQQQHTSQIIQDLVEESQLLAAYPNATESEFRKSARASSSSFADATRKRGGANITKQIEPFVYAADSAKIATLEAVVEKIETGQMAVDEAMGTLSEIRKFLNKDEDELDQTVNEDEGAGENQIVRKHRRNTGSRDLLIKEHQQQYEKSIWSKLDGNLGLIND